MKIHTILPAVITVLTGQTAFANTYSGQITDNLGTPLPGVTVTIAGDEENCDFCKSIESAAGGLFSFDDVPAGKYKLTVTATGYTPYIQEVEISGNATGEHDEYEIIVLESKSTYLTDVVITAKKINRFADREEIYLDDANRNFGNSAVDAISSLPQFRSTINGNTLTNISGTEVVVMIGGRRADPSELLSLTGKEIGKIVYYESAPVKYRHITDGPVVDISLSLSQENQYGFSLRARHAIMYAEGQGRLGFVFSNEHNYLQAEGNLNHTSFNNGESRETYDYTTLVNEATSTSLKKRKLAGSAKIGYQHITDANNFFVSLSYGHDKSKDRGNYRMTSTAGLLSTDYVKSINDEILENGGELDLYYSHTFSGGMELAADVLNTYYDTNSINDFLLTPDNQAETTTDYDTSTRAKTYSIIANVSFSAPLWIGHANIAGTFLYKNLNQNYINQAASDLSAGIYNNQRSQIYSLGYTGGAGKFSFSGLGYLIWEDYHLSQQTSDPRTTFAALLMLDYKFSRYFSLQYRGNVGNQMLGIGFYNNNETYLDTHFISRNNPELKKGYQYGSVLNPKLQTPDGKLYVSMEGGIVYCHDFFTTIIYREGDNYISQVRNIPSSFESYLAARANYVPVKWLTLSAGYTGIRQRLNMPDRKVVRHSNTAYGTISAVWRKWQASVTYQTSSKGFDGDIMTHFSPTVLASLMWKHRNISIGAEYGRYRQNRYSTGESEGFRYKKKTTWKEEANMVSLSFTWNFNIGKNRSMAAKSINNADTDRGIILKESE